MQFYVALLHDGMVDKEGNPVTTSLTLIDMHDISRSCKTFDVKGFFICHPSPYMRKLAHNLFEHWDSGFGSTYNANRKDALSVLKVSETLDEAITNIEAIHNEPPVIIATSAKNDCGRVSFRELKFELSQTNRPYLLLLGTGWGMGPELMNKAHMILSPIEGPSDFNHLSVRSALAIMLDRLFGK